MKAKTMSFLYLLVLVGSFLSAASRNVPVAFLHVNVIPMDQERILQDVTVLVHEGNIAAIEKNVHVPKSAIRVEGRGQYLIPGLVDAHAHVHVKEDLLLYLAHG